MPLQISLHTNYNGCENAIDILHNDAFALSPRKRMQMGDDLSIARSSRQTAEQSGVTKIRKSRQACIVAK